MTVSITTSTVSYTANGVQISFVGTFTALSTGDINAYIDDVATLSVVQGDIAVANAWSVVFNAPPIAGSIVKIVRNTPDTQTTDYTAYGRYQAEQIESDLDKLTMILQELSYTVDNPPPIVFPVQTAAATPFQPTASLSATDVQSAIEELDSENTAIDATFVLKTTAVISGDTNTLTVTNPTLANDVILTTRTNIANGLVKLDATGHVPQDLLSTAGLVFKGLWSASAQGSTPPPTGNLNGDFYIFDANGNMTLRESNNQLPHTVAVFVNDYMVFNTDPVYPGWYYVHNAQQQIITASGVTFVPGGTISASDVQQAIQQLDSQLSTHFYFQGTEAFIERLGSLGVELQFATSANGPRLLRAGSTRLQTELTGISVVGNLPNSSAIQNTGIFLLTSDGVTIGRLGYLGDQTFYVISDKPGAPVAINMKNLSGVNETAFQALPGSYTYLGAFGRYQAILANGELWVISSGTVSTGGGVSMTRFVDAADVTMGRMGFLGSNDMFIANDVPGYAINFLFGNGNVFRIAPAGSTLDSSLLVNGNISTPYQPTLPEHVTRKDYVDSKLLGFTSAPTAISAGFTLPHNLGVVPSDFSGYLVNVIAQAGYQPDDRITMPGVMGSGNVGYSVGANATQIWFARSGIPAIVPKVGGAVVAILEANWRVVLRASV